LDWVIVGGESGPGARPMDLDWARTIVKTCRSAGVAVFVKQLGKTWSSCERFVRDDPKGGDITRWPKDLRRREMPLSANG
jgi:protein gp37